MTFDRSVVHAVGNLDVESGGPSRSVPSLCNALVAEGWRVGLIARDRPFQNEDVVAATEQGVRLALVKSKMSLMALAVSDKDLSRALGPFNLVHNHGIWHPFNHSVIRSARHLGRVAIISPRGMLEPWAVKFHGARKAVAWWLFQRQDINRVSALHATSELELSAIRRMGIRTPVAVIPNGTWGPPRAVTSMPLHNIVFMSRIHPKKGLLLLVRAVQQAQEILRDNKWTLNIYGPDEGGHRHEVEQAVAAAGVQDLVTLHPPVTGDARWSVLRSASLFVLPTLSENFGVVVIEALSCGVPVITTTAAPWHQLVDERCGWWVPPNPDAIRNALVVAVAMRDEELFAMGARGQKLVERDYGWTKAGEKMSRFYEWCLAGGTRPDFVDV